MKKPLIGIPATVRTLEWGVQLHGNARQYYDAVVNHVGGTVFTIPSMEDTSNALDLLARVDGILLTGGTSMIHPNAYGKEAVYTSDLFDPLRDASSFVIIKEAVERGIPLFGICRGSQEINVAYGGTLHERIADLPGKKNHMPDTSLPLAEQFADAHDILIQPGGTLEKLWSSPRVIVSSAHAQAIDKVADRVRVEAVSEDGVVEAVSVRDAPAFSLAVQFHPEWGVAKNPFYGALFDGFSAAVRKYMTKRKRSA